MVLPPPPPQKPTYVSSSGQLTAPPLSKRLYDAARDVAEMAYLFVDTLVTPILYADATTSADVRPGATRGGGTTGSGFRSGNNNNSGGRLGGGSGGGGARLGGGGGQRTMADLRREQAANSCSGGSCG